MSLSPRALSLALTYVGNHWIPINNLLVSRLRSQIEKGFFAHDVELLVKEMSSDLGLFSRALSVAHDNGGLPNIEDPIRALEALGIPKLSQILTMIDESSKSHTIEDGSVTQKARIKEALMSSAAAETLAGSYSADSKLAQASALLRQLGLALVAWNYPDLYEECVASLKTSPQVSLEETIRGKLGFHPYSLALRLAEKWGFSQNATLTLIDPESVAEERDIVIGVGRTLATICKVSETLARASAPEVYPFADLELEKAKEIVEKQLGKKGLKLIQERFSELCTEYVKVLPDLFRPAALGDAAFAEPIIHGDCYSEKNPFIPHCTSVLRDRIVRLYDKLGDSKDLPGVLKTVVKDLVPTARFTGCAVYTIEPLSFSLEQQLSTISADRKLPKLVPCSIEHTEASPIPLAWAALEPIVALAKSQAGESYMSLAWCLGHSNRVGVIYVELPVKVFEGSPQKNLIHFKAICQALNDSLGLS